MRVVFTGCYTADAARPVCELFPSALCMHGTLYARGPAVFVAYHPSHVDKYGAWFEGLSVRVDATLRHAPLDPGGAVYLQVAPDSWVVVCENAGSLGAAMEAARLLHVSTVVCPAFPREAVPLVRDSLSRTYQRLRDRVRVHDEFKDGDAPGTEAEET